MYRFSINVWIHLKMRSFHMIYVKLYDSSRCNTEVHHRMGRDNEYHGNWSYC